MSQQYPTTNLSNDSAPQTRTRGLMEGILSSFPTVLFRLDSSGVFIESTGLGLKRLGLREGEVIGQSALELYPDFAERIREALNGGVVQFEGRGVTDGSPWWFDTYIAYDHEHGGARGFAIDISSKRQKDEALKRQEQRFSELFDTIPHGIVEIDTNGRITFCNRSFCRLIEVRHGALLGRDLAEFDIQAEGGETLKTYLASVIRYDSSCPPYMTVMRASSGKEIDARIDWNCKRDKSGEVVGFVSIVTDITSQKRAQEALEESEEKFSKAFRLSPDAITISKLSDGEFIEVNYGFQQITGYCREETLGRTSLELEVWSNSSEREEFVAKLKEDGRVRDLKIHFRMKSGELRSCQISAELIDFASQSCILATTRDISESESAACQIRESKERLELALHAANSGIWDWNIRTGHLDFNDRWAEIIGYRRHGISRHVETWRKMVHPDDLERALEDWRHYERGDVALYESRYRMKNKDGSYRVISDTGRIIEFDENGAPLRATGVQVDITERAEREQEIVRNSRLESLGVLAGGIAHDFNNILTAIVGELNLIRLGVDEGADVSQDIADCEERALKATELTQQLLSFSRGGEPLCAPLELRQLVDDTVELTLYGFAGDVSVSVSGELHLVNADRGQVRQALNAVLVNAIEATCSAGSIEVSVSNRLLTNNNPGSLPAGEYVEIAVSDNGAGIPTNDLIRVFDPYFTTKKGSSGLGLTGAYMIMRKHRGAIVVESTEGEGATFSLFLPRVTQETSACEKGGMQMPETKQSAQSIHGNILLMDDEESIRKIALRSLTRLGYTVQVAANGEEAIDIYQRHLQTKDPIDVVILDLTVAGGMGGAETVKVLREIDPEVTAFVSSGYCNDPVMANYQEYGFACVVTKPYRTADLHRTLQEALARRRTRTVQ